MNPIEQYRDSSLDGLVESRQASSRKTSRSRHSRRGSSAAREPYDPANLSDTPNVPTITYPGAESTGKQGIQRSFSQRARSRPYADEAFLDDATLDSQDRPAQSSASHHDPIQDIQQPVSSASRDKENDARRQQMIRDNIKSAAGSVRSPKDHNNQAGAPLSSTYHDVENDTGMKEAPTTLDTSLPADQRDWAPDRSPLQKLEVTLNDISKEEKRARVQEAEMLHREKTRSQKPDERLGTTTRRNQPSAASHPSTIEDAGIVRSLSNTHRDRLQHSTTIESHRPDPARLSMDRPSGQTFDYHNYFPPNRSVTITRRGKPIVSPEGDGTRRAVSGSQALPPPTAAYTAGQSRSVSATQPSQAVAGEYSGLASQRSTHNQPTNLERGSSQERNASRRAALEQLTGSSPPQGSRSNSQRAETESSSTFQPMRQVSASNRVPPSSFEHDRRNQRGLDGQSGVYGETDQTRSVGPSSTEPIGANAQASPGNKRRSSVSFKEPYDRRRPVDEWKAAETARLTADDFILEAPSKPTQSKTWWERDTKDRQSSGAVRPAVMPEAQTIDDRTAEFQPQLYLKCGPLLRYTGMKRTIGEGAKEYWRGTVMIVTSDAQSSYETAPTLRLFSQPRSLFIPSHQGAERNQRSAEHEDPIAGTTKMSRIGRALYVRPVGTLAEGYDLSQDETDDGLFQSSPPIARDNADSVSVTPLVSRNGESNGENLGRHKEIRGVRLYADPDRDVTFWLFKLEVELGHEQQHIGYRINRGAASGFWVPAEGETMNIMFHSCNGFSLSVNPDEFSGPDPLWRDVLNAHQSRPFHVMIGGGDQIYNDKIMNQTQLFKEWTANKNPHFKHHSPMTNEMKEELETFYLHNYSTWFSQGMFALAGSQIPMVNMWDDHDIIDGFGSYPHQFQLSPVFSGVGNIAYKYYMLFQQHSVDAITQADEPSWLLGYKPGPYIKQLSRSIFVNLGRSVALLALDCRTERMKNQVLSLDTCDMAMERCRKELIEGETKHLIVLLGVPIAYPRMNWLENVLTSKAMDPVKAMGRYGILKGGFLNRFDGGVEVLDDLDDHWTAQHHKEERNEFIKELQDLAAERSVRITILGGDVHLGAIGQFYSNPKLKIPKDRDHRYMPNVVSSAIVNTPPPEMLADVLNKRNKIHHLDQYTDESMIPMFTHDTNMKKRNNKHLLPRRNWCSITAYVPGRTPPSSRSSSPSRSDFEDYEQTETDARPQPKRRFSLSKEDVNPRTLFRRISSRNAPPTAYRDGGDDQRAASFDQVRSNQADTTRPTGMFHRRTTSETRAANVDRQYITDAPSDARESSAPRPGFHRRPTNMSEKAAKKGNVPAVDADGNEFDVNGHVNLEGGLDIVLHCEVNQHNHSGITEPYRLLVPALWYDGSSDREKLDAAESGGMQRKPTLLNRMGIGGRSGQKAAKSQGAGNWGQDEGDDASYSSEADEGAAEYRDKPQKKKFGLFGSLKKKQPQEDYNNEPNAYRDGRPDDTYRDGQSGLPAAAVSAPMNQPSVYNQVTEQAPTSNQYVSPNVGSRGGSGAFNEAYGTGNEVEQRSRPSFNHPPGQSRQSFENKPARSSSFKATNVLRKKSLNRGASTNTAPLSPVNTSQSFTGRTSNDYGQPATPTRQASYTIGSNPSTNSQNRGVRAADANPYAADPTYDIPYNNTDQPRGQNRVTRILSQPTNIAPATNPPSSYPQQEPLPGAPTDPATLSNPRQRSLRGNGILGRFTSRRSTSADRVPTTIRDPPPQQQQQRDDNELDNDFTSGPPQRVSSGYTGIEAYREKPKRGMSLRDRTRNFFGGRKRDDYPDDESDGYSYSSEESYSSAGLDDGREQNTTLEHDRDRDRQYDQRRGTSHEQQRRPNMNANEQPDSYLDEPHVVREEGNERPGMARGLSQKIRLNMMRMGGKGGKGARTRERDRDREGDEEGYY